MYSDRARLTATLKTIKNRSLKLEYGNRIIDEIIRRTQEDNKDKSGKAFAPYSSTYVKSQIFEIYNKEKGDVNMTLTGEMLSSMVVNKIVDNDIEISFASKAQNDKAHGHINGIRARKNGKLTKVRRDFFGVDEKTQVKILKEVIRDFNNNEEGFSQSEKDQTTLRDNEG